MKKQFVLGMVAITALQVAGPAFAQHRGGAPLPPPPPSSVRERHQEGSVELQRITRASQGQWYRVSLRNRVRLDRVEITVLSQSLKIHEASLVTASGSRIDIRELKNTSVLNSGSRIISENLNIREDILTIDIRAESMGGLADMRVSAYSSDERPQLVVEDLAPSRPSNPSRPDRPGRPDNNRPGRYCGNPQDVVNELQRLNIDLDTWLTRMNRSTYGSTEYNMASKEASAVSVRMVSVAQSPRAKQMYLDTAEQLAQQALTAMNRATYGSLAYNTQSNVATALFDVLEGALDNAIDCEVRSTQDLISKAELYLGKMNRSTYGGLAYNSYSKVTKKAFGLISSYYVDEAARTRKTYMDLDVDAEAFQTKRNSLTYGSLGYNSFDQLTTKVVALSQASLMQAVRYLSANERFELVRMFETKRNRQTYGSLLYNHFDKMKTIAANGR